MPRINVLWVIDHVCYDGSLHGGGRLYWNVLPRFDADRFRIVPCMLRADGTIRKVFKDSPVPVRILDKAKFDPTTLWTFFRLIKKENIHVMHLHCYGASTFGRLAGLITGVPALIHDYDTEVYFPYPSYLDIVDRVLASVTQGAIAASPMVRDFLIKKRKIEDSRIHMMLHAIPREKYTPSENATSARERLGIDEDTRVIGTVTKLGPQRGNEFLLQAAREVVKAFPTILFVIVYKPMYFHRLPNRKYVHLSRTDTESKVGGLEALVKQLGIEKNVRFIECPENPEQFLSAFDLFVAPFLSKRFSSVHLLEAMARGKPIIATDIGEQCEIIQNEVNGYLVRPGDVTDMARRIVEVLSEPNELDRMGHEAREKSEQYSVDMYVQRLQRLYQELAADSAAGR